MRCSAVAEYSQRNSTERDGKFKKALAASDLSRAFPRSPRLQSLLGNSVGDHHLRAPRACKYYQNSTPTTSQASVRVLGRVDFSARHAPAKGGPRFTSWRGGQPCILCLPNLNSSIAPEHGHPIYPRASANQPRADRGLGVLPLTHAVSRAPVPKNSIENNTIQLGLHMKVTTLSHRLPLNPPPPTPRRDSGLTLSQSIPPRQIPQLKLHQRPHDLLLSPNASALLPPHAPERERKELTPRVTLTVANPIKTLPSSALYRSSER